MITGYEVRFGQSSEKILTFGPDENFYITSGEERAQNALVEVCSNSSVVVVVGVVVAAAAAAAALV